MSSLKEEVNDLTTCLKCQHGKKFKEQIQQNIEKYEEFIKRETDKLPEQEPDVLKLSYCRGAIDQLKDITTLTKRSLLFINEVQKAKNKRQISAYRHKEKLKGRL